VFSGSSVAYHVYMKKKLTLLNSACRPGQHFSYFRFNSGQSPQNTSLFINFIFLWRYHQSWASSLSYYLYKPESSEVSQPFPIQSRLSPPHMITTLVSPTQSDDG